MPYNDSRGNRSYNSGNSDWRKQNAPAGQRPAPPVKVLPEKVPEDYVDRAEAVILGIQNQKPVITTSKIRNLLSLVSEIYNVEKLRTEKELCPESVAKVGMMRVRTAYEAGRDKTAKAFVEEAKLLQYQKGIGNDREALIRFAHYMEALVAYHRFYIGGKEV